MSTLRGASIGNTPEGFRQFADGGGVIVEDRFCGQCRFNLRGLSKSGRCPECGTFYTLTGSKSRGHDRLGDAPLGYINRLAASSIAIGLLPAVILLSSLVLGWFGIVVMAVATLGYLGAVGVFVMRRERGLGAPSDEVRGVEWPRLRLSILVGQVALVLSPAVFVLAEMAKTPAGSGLAPGASAAAQAALAPATHTVWSVGLMVVGVGMLLAGAASFGPFGVYAARLAHWAEDDDVAHRWRSAGVVFGGCCVLLVGLSGVQTLYEAWNPAAQNFLLLVVRFVMVLLLLFGWLVGAAAMVSGAFFCFYAVRFASTCRWARRNVLSERERDRRVAERRKRDAERLAEGAMSADPGAYSGVAEVRGPGIGVVGVEVPADGDIPLPVEGSEVWAGGGGGASAPAECPEEMLPRRRPEAPPEPGVAHDGGEAGGTGEQSERAGNPYRLEGEG